MEIPLFFNPPPPINLDGERRRKREMPLFYNHLCYAMV